MGTRTADGRRDPSTRRGTVEVADRTRLAVVGPRPDDRLLATLADVLPTGTTLEMVAIGRPITDRRAHLLVSTDDLVALVSRDGIGWQHPRDQVVHAHYDPERMVLELHLAGGGKQFVKTGSGPEVIERLAGRDPLPSGGSRSTSRVLRVTGLLAAVAVAVVATVGPAPGSDVVGPPRTQPVTGTDVVEVTAHVNRWFAGVGGPIPVMDVRAGSGSDVRVVADVSPSLARTVCGLVVELVGAPGYEGSVRGVEVVGPDGSELARDRGDGSGC